ncbi:MAG: alpha/beta hydrolase [Pseudonocardia sp.]|nr:alpha/beta hydrolase [Pseudonocardia sp.]
MSDVQPAGTGPVQDGHDRRIDLGGPVHYVDFGGRPDGPTFVLVHGLGGSHLNWELFAPLLTPTGRVLAVDLPGFGLSEPGERPATVPANVLVLEAFVRRVADGPVVLIGNSMGGMISILLTGRTPDLIGGLVLIDAALPLPLPASSPRDAVASGAFLTYALPGVGERLMRGRRRRVGPRALVHTMLRLCGVDPGALPPELVARSVTLVERRADVAGMDRAFLSAARSLAWVLTFARSYRTTMSSITAPVLLVHGEQDRLVPVAAARDAARRNPTWRYVELPGVGHVPQLQVPDRLAGIVADWLAVTRS